MILQLILVAIVILWPGLVTDFLDKPAPVNPNQQIEIRQDDGLQGEDDIQGAGHIVTPAPAK